MATDRQYWASKKVEEMLPEAFKRIDAWYKHVRERRIGLWRLALAEYYAGRETQGRTGEAGEQGEFTTIKVNHVHNLGEHVVTAIAGQPPAFLPQAQNNDHESTAQVAIAGAVLEQAATQKGLDEVFTQATRRAWVLTEGVAAAEWDERIGEDYASDPTTGEIVKTGDVRIRTYVPPDVVRDFNKETAGDHEWFILRRFENRYNVLAQAVKAAQKAGLDEQAIKGWEDSILAIPSKLQDESDRPRLVENDQTDESDDIAVWELRHAKTDALPQGLRCIFVSPEVYLTHGPCPYRDLYVFRMAPEEQIGTEAGYSQSLDLLAPQHGVNAAYSSMLSSLAALGHSVVVVGTNSTVTVEELKAFTMMKVNGGADGVKTLSLLPSDALKPHSEFAANMIQQMEVTSGVNAVRRGNLEATGKLSGSAYALIDAKFIEAVVGLQRSFKTFASKLATAIVQLYQDFAKVEHTVKVAGKSNRVYAKKFTGEGLKKVLRVDVEMADPMSRTSSGRLQLAEMLLKVPDANGGMMIKTPEQFMQVVRTGRLEPLTEGQGKELDNIKAENEMLGEGQPPQVFIYDNHPLHVQEHYSVMASPEARVDQGVMQATLDHVAEHLTAWQQAPLDGLAARKIPPPPSLSMMPPPVPGETTGTPPPAPGATSDTGAPAPDGAAGGQPEMPRLPSNPQTGEQAPQPPA